MDNIRVLVSEELSIIDNRLSAQIECNNNIYKSLNDFISCGSKRIRSLITLLYLKANNAVVNDEVITLLTAVELIHNASLLHDDVVDNSHERRGTQTLYDKYDSKISVLSGDYVLSVAVENLLNLQNFNILHLLLKTTKQMSNAEINQYLARNNDMTEEQYLEIIRGKTASLFSACLNSSALLTNLDSVTANDFGTKFGIIFQINNDLEELSAKNDIANGVKTIVNTLGIEKTLALKDNYKEELRDILKYFPANKYRQGIEDLIKLL